MLRYILLPFLIINLFCQRAFSQESKGVKVMACVKNGEVILRWAPNNPVLWQQANEAGYIVEKYLIVKDKKVVNRPVSTLKILTPQPLKPQPLDAWRPAVDIRNDQYAAIAAQSIYGKAFAIDPKNANLYQIIEKARDQENRFGFSLYAADNSAEAATLMGLRLVDKNIVKGERYLYKVYANIPSAKLKVDTGSVFVDVNEITVFPMPREIKADFTDKMVRLEWDNRYYQNFYTGYFIERSEDGQLWKTLNKEPFVSIGQDGNPADIYFYVDSLPQNNKLYWYRIKGKNFFAEFSEPSPFVKGKGMTALRIAPAITTIQLLDKEKLKLDWELADIYNKDISELRIYRAAKTKGPYKLLKTVPKESRSVIIENPKSINYFVVAALGVDSNEYKSLPVMFQLEDNTPPAPPTGLTGAIDTNGVVTIQWKSNTEEDFYGYSIFVSNSPKDEFSNLTRKINKDTVFKDTITLKTLSKKIYYRLTAMDNHFNPSQFSEMLLLKKPDLIAPSSPVFTSVVAADSSIYLQWINSTSDDVIGHVLYRSVAGSNEWAIIAKFDTITSKLGLKQAFTDKGASLKAGIVYDYVAVAVDDSRNESPLQQTVRSQLIDRNRKALIEKVTASVDRTNQEIVLKWNYAQSGVDKFMIYRRGNSDPLTLYKSVNGDETAFSDKNVRSNTTYVYRLRAEHKDGGTSPFTKEITVEF